MEQKALELKKIFNGLIEGFGLNHARIYYALLSSEVKTARQLIQETGVNQATTYAVLRELIKWGLAKQSSTNPTTYFIENPLKSFEQQAKRKEKAIGQKRKMLEDLIAADTDDSGKYILKIGKGQQTKLVDIATKREIRYREELTEIKDSFDKMFKEAPEKQKQLALAHYKR